MKTIKLTQGKETIVDDEDYEELNKFKWCIGSVGYAIRRESSKINKDRPTIYMHKYIFNNPNTIIDHINGNTLDNRKCNLRICTKSENRRNSKKPKNAKTSKYKGVYFFKDSKKWRARIRVLDKLIDLGLHINEIDAAKAYNEAAIKYFGEFAKLNNIPLDK